MPQGCIHISKEAWRNGHAEPTTTQAWHKALLLPDTYRVVEVRSGPGCQFSEVWLIIVESDLIPAIEGRVLPEISPVYRRDAGAHAVLERIETRVWDSAARDWRVLDEVA